MNERSVVEPYSGYGASETEYNQFGSDVSRGQTGAQLKYSPEFNTTSPSYTQDESDLTRKNSIPRKQLPHSPQSQTYGVNASSPTNHVRSGSQPIQQQSSLANANNIPQLTKGEDTYQASRYHNRSRPISKATGAASTPEDVVDRAKSNTVRTEVVETLAPGKHFIEFGEGRIEH